MSTANYKVGITDRDYNGEHYDAWVQASSRNQAIAIAASLATREKLRRGLEQQTGTKRPEHVAPLMEPVVRADYCPLDEYWAHREQVEVEEQ